MRAPMSKGYVTVMPKIWSKPIRMPRVSVSRAVSPV
jgi:hypothetical protein